MSFWLDAFSKRGFLPAEDPLLQFDRDSPFSLLDEIGHDLPSLLLEPDFRNYARALTIPSPIPDWGPSNALPELRLYFVRLAFICSAYVNQVGQPEVTELPANLAIPLCQAAKLLGTPPILNYAGYALYNWKRFDKGKGIELGNIDTIQNFVHLYDEHWFILVHVEIEHWAAKVLAVVLALENHLAQHGTLDAKVVNSSLELIENSLVQQLRVLKRIPERMSSELYFKTFRPYIRFFEHVRYEGVSQKPLNYRGETGAQSSIMPTLINLMKIEHTPSILVDHLLEIRKYMPPSHREFISQTAKIPAIKPLASPALFDQVLELIAQFREVHYGWAMEYIHKHVSDPRGTGGTPYMKWLRQLIDETRQMKYEA